jgi:hypothetical protein
MKWRQQFGAVLCGVLLIAVISAVAIRANVPAVAAGAFGLTDTSASNPPLANRPNTTSRAKEPPTRGPRVSLPFEITSPGDVGSLWDVGPAYDLSR